jgi:hypothetical protein
MALPARGAGRAGPWLGVLQLSVGLLDSNGAVFAPGHHELPAAPSRASTLGRRLARVLGLLIQTAEVRTGTCRLRRLSLSVIAYIDVRHRD